MQTILGSGGAIGIELAKSLQEFTQNIKLVSRNPQKVNPADQLFPANLLDENQVRESVKGSTVVYLTVGFPYNLKSWQNNWPKCISYVIKACKEHDCKLVFFDNIYLYDQDSLNGMTEEAPILPPSKKGQVRADVFQKIMGEVNAGNLTALVARCADYYGPAIPKTSMLTETVFNPLSNGKKANWLGSDQYRHSFTFTPDAGKATALLGNTSDAYNQVWHLPTASNPFTGKEWIRAIAKELGVDPKYQVAPKMLIRIMGLFMPIMKEMVEMTYQYDRDYVFDSGKFAKHFDLKPTPYLEGIKSIVNLDYRKS